MAEGPKAMALEGHGVAFLPHSAVKRNCVPRLVSAAPADTEGLQMIMDVRAYRESLRAGSCQRHGPSPLAYLQTQAGPCLGKYGHKVLHNRARNPALVFHQTETYSRALI